MSDLDKFNYECEDQIDIFDLIRKPISITKPIRLIELLPGMVHRLWHCGI